MVLLTKKRIKESNNYMKKGTYLITGCAGFIGSNLVKKLYKNYELILVDDLSEGSILICHEH